MSVESIETVVDARASSEDSRTTPRSFAIAARLPWIAIAQILVVAAILLSIQMAVDYGLVKRIYLASPTQILAAFPQLFAGENLLFHLSVTLAEAAVGMGLSAVLGIATGIAMGLFPRYAAAGDRCRQSEGVLRRRQVHRYPLHPLGLCKAIRLPTRTTR